MERRRPRVRFGLLQGAVNEADEETARERGRWICAAIRVSIVVREGRVAAVGGATIRDTLDELVAATNGVGRAVDAEHLPEKATGKSPDSVSE